MYSDEILEEKWRVQKRLSKQANYDVKELIKNAHKNITFLAKELDIELKYANRKGDYLPLRSKA